MSSWPLYNHLNSIQVVYPLGVYYIPAEAVRNVLESGGPSLLLPVTAKTSILYHLYGSKIENITQIDCLLNIDYEY